MKSILAAIAAVLAGMRRSIVQLVRVGGRWITKIVSVADPTSGGAPSALPMTPDVAQALKPKNDDVTALRNAAGQLVQGQPIAPADEKALHAGARAWLGCMTQHELCKLLLADDATIASHMRGKERMRGMVPYDKQAIADVTAARAHRPAPRVAKRTLRAVLAERENPGILLAR